MCVGGGGLGVRGGTIIDCRRRPDVPHQYVCILKYHTIATRLFCCGVAVSSDKMAFSRCTCRASESERERENSNSKILFYKDCSLGSVKNLSNN